MRPTPLTSVSNSVIMNGKFMANLWHKSRGIFVQSTKAHGWYVSNPSQAYAHTLTILSQESQDRRATLTEGKILNIARMIQFIYIGKYSHVNLALRCDVELVDLVPSGTVFEFGKAMCYKNLCNSINKEMFKLAQYFDIPSLRTHVAEQIVDKFAQDHDLVHPYLGRQDNNRKFSKDFCGLYELLPPFLHENETMEHQATRLVKLLLKHKVKPLNSGRRNKPYQTTLCRDLSDYDIDDIDDSGRDLNARIREYGRANGGFAMKLAERLEKGFDTAIEELLWTHKAVTQVQEVYR